MKVIACSQKWHCRTDVNIFPTNIEKVVIWTRWTCLDRIGIISYICYDKWQLCSKQVYLKTNYYNTNKGTNKRWQWKLLQKASRSNKKRYYPMRSTSILRVLLKKKRGNGHRKFSFIKAVIFGWIVNLSKSPLKNLPWISNLSSNAILFLVIVFLFVRSFLNFGSVFRFCDMKNNLKDFIMKVLKK